MAKARVGVGLVVGCLLLGGASPAWAAPTVAQMLAYRPKQEGVEITTPTPDQYGGCEVKLINGSRPGSSGWLLLDSKKQPLRRFFDSNGDKQIDLWSYYKDGTEVYREIDSKLANRPNLPAEQRARPDQFRWLNSAGMKWGVDADDDGKIDSWKVISSEEVAQEVYLAVAARNYARLQAVLLTDTELRTLRLPAAEMERMSAKLKQAQARFQEACTKLTALGEKTQPVQVESAVAQCVPADQVGTDHDLLKHTNRSIVLAVGDKKNEWLQTGEMVLVGTAWRLVEGPVLGQIEPKQDPAIDPAVQKLMEDLAELDKKAPPVPPQPEPKADVVRYNLQRVALLEQILNKMKAGDREQWLRQMADNLSAAALHSEPSDTSSLKKLQQLKEQTAQAAPGTPMAAYMTFRVLWTEYSPKLDKGTEVQKEWLEKLAGFVQSYPNADDTADALAQLAMGSEFTGKDSEAARWWKQLASSFSEHPMAKKAAGAVARLELVGKDIVLSGKMLSGAAFDIASLKGKVVAVYYWASYGKTVEDDFAKLKALHTKLNAKGFEIVTVNLDDQPEAAATALQKAVLPGTHLVQPAVEGGGLNSPLALQYGIMGVPTLFLVGKDGKVTSRTLHMTDLEEAIQKAL
jgi:thiol-disulfide isomerase/thioredoxin